MSLLQTIIDLLFPPRCPFCQVLLSSENKGEGSLPPWGQGSVQAEGVMCFRCAGEIHWLMNSCFRCARPLTGIEGDCPHCREQPLAFDYCCALGSYRGTLRKALHRFKYRGEKGLAYPLGRLLASRLAVTGWLGEVNAVIPVPLSRQRRSSRGYNQADLLAERLGRDLDIPILKLLQRTRDTKTQADLGRQDRWENIENAFIVSPGKQVELQGKKVLLVDDILTSGATAHAASLALKEAGASQVSLTVIAR